MTDDRFVADLELSVRTTNLLLRAGVATRDQFLALTRTEFLSLTGAGARSWREVEAAQTNIRELDARGDRLREIAADRRTDDRAWEEFRALVSYLNTHMEYNPQHRVVDAGRGFLTAVRSDPDDAEKRMTP